MENLTQLQSLVKRDPESYREVVQEHIQEFENLFTEFPEAPNAQHERLGQLMKFLGQVSAFFVEELKNFPSKLLTVLNNYHTALNPEFRKALFGTLVMLRNREQIPALSILPVCFKLFRCQDKELRRNAFNFMVSDIKRINKHSQNYQLNKQLQGFVYSMVDDSNLTAAKKSIHLMMTMYTKRIWTDSRTVNVIASGCCSKQPKIVRIASTFLIEADQEMLASDSEDEEEEPCAEVIGAKKSKSYVKNKEKELKLYQKRQRRKERRKLAQNPAFLTVDQLNDPQGFVESVFKNLKKNFSKGNYDARILMMQVIARVVGRHKLMLLDLYSYLHRYLNPKAKRIAHILVICAEACHELVPPDELKPIITKLKNNFVSEHCSEETITQGLNAIREICKRQPLAVEAEELEDLTGFKDYKNKSVIMAASSLINLYREVKPSLLKKKLRGEGEDQFGNYGESKVYTSIPGVEYLSKPPGEKEFKHNQTVFLREPMQKSANMKKLEEYLEKNQTQEQSSGEDSEKDSNPELSEEKPESQDEKETQDFIAIGCERILTQKDFRIIRQRQREAEARLRKSAPQEESSQEEEENPHGFLEDEDINTHKPEKKKSIVKKEKQKFKRNEKKGGKTHKQHAKNKPSLMVVAKKRTDQKDKLKNTTKKLKNVKQQLGRINKRFGKASKKVN